MARLHSPLGAAVGAALAASVAGFANAQPPVGETSVALEEVIVTARRTAESLQQAPVAVTALTTEVLANRQVSDVSEVARFAPGLVFDKAFGRATGRPVIRGQGNVLAGTQNGVEAGAAYFIDGMYYPGDIQSLDLNQIERVEVIRGPQSALFGRNTYAGAINFVTRAPRDTFGGGVRAAADSDQTEASLRFEGPLVGDVLTGSVSMRYYDFKGQWRNVPTDEDVGQETTKSIAAVLSWQPSEDFNLRLRGTYNSDRDGPRPFMFQDSSFNNCYRGTRSIAYYTASGAPGSPSNNDNQYYCGEIQPRAVSFNTARPVVNQVYTPAVPSTSAAAAALYDPAPGVVFAGVDRDLKVASAMATWDIFGSGYTLTADYLYRDDYLKAGSDSDFTTINSIPTITTAAQQNAAGTDESSGADTTLTTYRDYSVEVRLASPTDRDVRWMIGAFYYYLDQNLYDINFRWPDGNSIPDQAFDLANVSVFGLVEWRFARSWTLTMEGRHMEDTKRQWDRCTSTAQWPACTPPPAQTLIDNPGQVLFTGKGKFSRFTPRVTLKRDVSPGLNFYGIYAEGVQPGGFNGLAATFVSPQQATYGPEESRNYELGMKSTWFDGRLRVNVALYQINDSNVQLTMPLYPATTGADLGSTVTTQADGTIRGGELEATWRVAEPLILSLTYALSDAKFDTGCDDFQWTLTSGGGNDVSRQDPFDSANPATGGTNLNGNGDCSVAGHRFALSARNSGSFAVDFRHAINADYQLFANADVSYVGKRAVQVHADPYVPSALLVGARFGVRRDNWAIAVYGRNLTSEDAPAVATRWFTTSFVGPDRTAASLVAAGLPYYPGVPNPAGPTQQSPVYPAATGLDSVASYALPRAFFAMLRRQRQVGVEFSFNF